MKTYLGKPNNPTPSPPKKIYGPCQYFFHPFIDAQCYIERLFAPSEDVSVKLNTVYANIVFNEKDLLKTSQNTFTKLIRALKCEKQVDKKKSRGI